MKTVEFKRNWRGDDYTCGCHFKCNGADHSGTYVLASEANEQDDWNVKKIKELELEQIKDKGRIKVLEDALKEILERHLWSDDEPNVATMMAIARAALEVKP
jgi:hypothetical protein